MRRDDGDSRVAPGGHQHLPRPGRLPPALTDDEGLRDINPIDPPGSEAAVASTAECRANPLTAARTCVAES